MNQKGQLAKLMFRTHRLRETRATLSHHRKPNILQSTVESFGNFLATFFTGSSLRCVVCTNKIDFKTVLGIISKATCTHVSKSNDFLWEFHINTHFVVRFLNDGVFHCIADLERTETCAWGEVRCEQVRQL